MIKNMLINVLQPEESRIAILEDGVLEELYVERTSNENLVGNIYKGRVVNIEPSIQAAFVDFGIGRNGFLHVSDVEAQYFRQPGDGNLHKLPHGDSEPEATGDRGRRGGSRNTRSKPPIQEIFKRSQEVLVQVIKESVGKKGPTLSTYISIPGRYLVLMPGLNRVGVSRKIESDDQRRLLRDLLKELNPPKGLGFIVRTAGVDRSKKDLSRDLAYLTRLWKVVVRRINRSRGPGAIYLESDMIIRTIRDIFTSDIDEVWVDEPNAFESTKEFLSVTMPRYVNKLKLYEGTEPLFHKYNLEQEITQIQQRRMPLPGGGSIVIDQTEALVAIDVNSGSFRADGDAEQTAFRINLAAAKEITRQLRLRDLGGVVVNDFIDMREERHRRELEQSLRDAVKRDRARTKILKMSAFGIIEMTRQRIRPSLKRSVYQDCPTCEGLGQIKTAESMAIDVMRLLQLVVHRPEVASVEVGVHANVAQYLNNRRRNDLATLEKELKGMITIRGSDMVTPEHLDFRCINEAGGEYNGWMTPGETDRREQTRRESEEQARQPADQTGRRKTGRKRSRQKRKVTPQQKQ